MSTIRTIKQYIEDYRDNDYKDDEDTVFKYKFPRSRLVKKFYGRKTPIIITRQVFDLLHVSREAMLVELGYNHHVGSTDQPPPIMFLLGQKANKISKAILCLSGGGCGNMPYIPNENLNEAMYSLIKDGYFPAGLARVGFFDGGVGRDENYDFGNGLNDIANVMKGQGLVFISLGLDGFSVYFPVPKEPREDEDGDTVYVDWEPMSYRILNPRMKGGIKHGKRKKSKSHTRTVSRTTQGVQHQRRNDDHSVLREERNELYVFGQSERQVGY